MGKEGRGSQGGIKGVKEGRVEEKREGWSEGGKCGGKKEGLE